MHRQTFFATVAAGVLAASNIGAVQAQQSGATGSSTGVVSAAPIHSESMISLKASAQRLREAIQSLAQKPPGSAREQAMSDARRALRDTQQSMVRLPAEYRVSGIAMSNVPIVQSSPAQNRSFGDSVRELQIAADRLRDAIQEMAQAPAGADRDGAVRQAHEALLETQQAMAWVPGYPSTASSQSYDSTRAYAPASDRAHGTVAAQSGAGSIAGGAINGQADVVSTAPNYKASMARLQQAAQKLRESVQAMAKQSPGPARNKAMEQARQALYDTQTAMLRLPPELRTGGNLKMDQQENYTRSMERLMQATEKLRESVQAMAQQPAGAARNKAMEEAREAILEANLAMVYLPPHLRTAGK